MTGGLDLMRDQVAKRIVYAELKKEANLDEDIVDQIDKDIKRTFFPAYHDAKVAEDPVEVARLELENETMRAMTKRILIAYASFDKTVRYVQGFNSIVAGLLYTFHLAKLKIRELEEKPELKVSLKLDEEEVFYTFLGIMTILGWRIKFLSGMDDISLMCDDFSTRMKKEDPLLYQKFFRNDVDSVLTKIPPVAYFAPFYLTICMHITPLGLAGKIIDLYLMIRENTIHYVIMGVLQTQRTKLLDLDSEEQIMAYLKNDLMRDVFETGCIGSVLIAEHLMEFYHTQTI